MRTFKTRISTCDHKFFDTIDSEIKAYLLGFFLADGCISTGKRIMTNNEFCTSYRFGICNAIDDEEAIKLFKEFIAFDNKLCYRKHPGKKDTIGIVWTSEYMFNILKTYNISCRKTYDTDFKFPLEIIPEHLIKHFVRGFFDGDGTVSLSGPTFNFGFIFVSLFFCEQIFSIFEKQFPGIIGKYNQRPSKNCIRYETWFSYNKNKLPYIKSIYNWLYEDANFYLSRKKRKFECYFEYRAKATDNTVEQCNA